MQSVLSFILITILSFSALSKETVVAEVGSKKITLKEFNKKYKEVVKNTVNPPPKDLFLEDLVRYEVGVMEAQRRNLKADPIVQERIRQVLYVDLIEKEVGAKSQTFKVTESEMKRYYRKNPEVRTSHILIQLKPSPTKREKTAAKKRAHEIYSDVKKSKKPFEELVKLYSDDSISKRNGGDIGWQSSITLARPYYNAALKLKKNRYSNLIETKFGYHIIKLTGKRSYKEADKRKIRAAVMEKKKKAIFDKYFSKLKSKYKVKTYKSSLK